MPTPEAPALELFGRPGSHFTRLPRLFAHDLGVTYAFRPVPDMRSHDPAEYGGHPGLKLPTLRTAAGPVFGAENICRWLAANAATPRKVVWSDGVERANRQEMVWLGMNAQVQILVSTRVFGLPKTHPYVEKQYVGLLGIIYWLNNNFSEDEMYSEEDCISLLEYSLFSLVDHICFRSTIDVEAFDQLAAFRLKFAERSCARATPYTG